MFNFRIEAFAPQKDVAAYDKLGGRRQAILDQTPSVMLLH